MKVTIVYFSGTGGTKRVAEALAKALIQKQIQTEVYELIYEQFPQNGDEDLLIVLYAVHALNAPEPVYQWIRGMERVDGISAAVISVSGGGEVMPNTACRTAVIRKLKAKGYCVNYETMLVMPSNFLIQADHNTALRLLQVLPERAERIADDLISGKAVRTSPNIIDRVLSFLGEGEKLVTGLFGRGIKADGGCNGCGLCERNCPTKNISLENKKPVFSKRCVMCLRCIYNCPKNALHAGAGKSIVFKTGYSLDRLEREAENTKPTKELPKGVAWAGVKKYLEEQQG
ncbi:MAG: hypothetical protein BGN88_14495 [Clostridiales bacterium 43-6]|nr:MAG: hypothetical protein BGN88_14495 [Clostridiales bacterium 43-6]